MKSVRNIYEALRFYCWGSLAVFRTLVVVPACSTRPPRISNAHGCSWAWVQLREYSARISGERCVTNID